MFAINHAATALMIKRRYPKVPLVWLLLSVQFIEILWVLFNYLGIERTSTDAAFDTVSNLHLEYMPYSHSIASSLVFACVAWFLAWKLCKQRMAAAALAIGVFSHIVLDVITHTQDIAIIPFVFDRKIGLGLYDVPLAAFFVETAYGLLCWWVFRGGKGLLVVILVCNLADITLFFVTLKGPEILMVNRPLWVVSAVAFQIIITLILVGVFAKPKALALEQRAG